MKRRPQFLLINPYIYDFAAYDLWSKPLGLLYIASVLEENGSDVKVIDAMDRWHPAVLRLQGLNRPKSRPFGDGHFFKEQVTKPSLVSSVPRKYYRYGMPPSVLEKEIRREVETVKPDAILVTSGMTYWYQGVHETIRLCKELVPDVPVLLGGIYATLFTDHATRTSGADLVIAGEGERTILPALSKLTGFEYTRTYSSHDDFPKPAYHHYPTLEYAAMMTTRGCPYSCSFCATHSFTEHFNRRRVSSVVEEIAFYRQHRDIRNITFYDDALFVNADAHIKPILREVIARHIKVHFHTPNGLFARLIDEELADLLVASGFKTIRLSYETKNIERQQQMRKVTDHDLEKALERLQHAGFPSRDAVVYLIMGLPGQTPFEVEESIQYVHELGARVSLSSFSPIPHTEEWNKAIELFQLPADEPLLTNKSIYPLKHDGFTMEDFERLKTVATRGNRRVRDSVESATISDYNVYA